MNAWDSSQGHYRSAITINIDAGIIYEQIRYLSFQVQIKFATLAWVDTSSKNRMTVVLLHIVYKISQMFQHSVIITKHPIRK